jgi:CBS domain-containing protein
MTITTGVERAEWLKAVATQAKEEPVELSVRQLLAKFNAQRRGYVIAMEIGRELKRSHLRTDPPFTDVWIDARVRLVPLEPESDNEVLVPKSADISLRIGMLPSANTDLVWIQPTESLATAQGVMMTHDFSQLPVLKGERDSAPRSITWESIAQARVSKKDIDLADVLVPAVVVSQGADLVREIPRIAEAGFVLVRNIDNRIGGIVTTVDLSLLFSGIASPFLMLGEIERRLRQINGRVFKLDELKAARDPNDTNRPVLSTSDLTLGEHIRLMEFPANWSRYGWELDRTVILKELSEVRRIRNDVMHFNPDPLTSEQERTLINFLKLVRGLDQD